MEIKLSGVIKRELKARNISLNELARKTSIPLSTLHGYVQGSPPSAKNMKHLLSLSNFFQVGISELLFNVKESKERAEVLFSTTFTDSDRRYRLTIEKIPK